MLAHVGQVHARKLPQCSPGGAAARCSARARITAAPATSSPCSAGSPGRAGRRRTGRGAGPDRSAEPARSATMASAPSPCLQAHQPSSAAIGAASSGSARRVRSSQSSSCHTSRSVSRQAWSRTSVSCRTRLSQATSSSSSRSPRRALDSARSTASLPDCRSAARRLVEALLRPVDGLAHRHGGEPADRPDQPLHRRPGRGGRPGRRRSPRRRPRWCSPRTGDPRAACTRHMQAEEAVAGDAKQLHHGKAALLQGVGHRARRVGDLHAAVADQQDGGDPPHAAQSLGELAHVLAGRPARVGTRAQLQPFASPGPPGPGCPADGNQGRRGRIQAGLPGWSAGRSTMACAQQTRLDARPATLIANLWTTRQVIHREARVGYAAIVLAGGRSTPDGRRAETPAPGRWQDDARAGPRRLGGGFGDRRGRTVRAG